ncbi:MAG TPA: hypothetical protein VFE98_02795 [Candidatus Bathyarchaeia archaeon]|nr:hypothetical protein [Candidatus Bathyarchaeia archaeon]
MISKLFRIGIPVLSFLVLLTPAIPHVHAAGEVFTFTPVPARQQETGTAADVLVMNVSRATIGTAYQFTWGVTDPSGVVRNHSNQTVATAASFLISLQYPRDFATSIVLIGNYNVIINETLPTSVPNVASGQFQVGLTDRLTYQRTNTVSIKATGYRNLEMTTINIFQGSTSANGYPTTITADSTGQLSTSWQIPVNAPIGGWTVSLTGSQTSKIVPDRQAFTMNPANVTISPLLLGQVTIQRTQTQSVSFTVSYSTGPVVQTGSAKIRLTESDGVTSVFATAVYNSTYAAYRATYMIPASSQKGNWLAAIDPGMFNDSYGNTGPVVGIVRQFTVYPTNVTIAQITVAQGVIQRTQSQYYSFSVFYLNGLPVQAGSTSIRITAPDGTTSFIITANYNSSTGLYQAVSKTPINAPTGAWVATIEPNSFDDGYGNGGPLTSVVRGFNVQLATFNIILTIPNQTYTTGQVIPVYATITNPNGTIFTNGTVTVTFSSNGSPTGTPLSLSYVQGQSRWAGSYVVRSADPSGLWVTTVKVMDAYGNAGQQTQSVIVNTSPAAAIPQSLTFWFFVAALIAGSGGAGLLLVRRFNTGQGSFDELFKLTGGEFSPSTTLLILGDTGSGTTTLSLELMYRQLSTESMQGSSRMMPFLRRFNGS